LLIFSRFIIPVSCVITLPLAPRLRQHHVVVIICQGVNPPSIFISECV